MLIWCKVQLALHTDGQQKWPTEGNFLLLYSEYILDSVLWVKTLNQYFCFYHSLVLHNYLFFYLSEESVYCCLKSCISSSCEFVNILTSAFTLRDPSHTV